MKNFEALGLTQPLLDGLAGMGFENPTEIQQQAIPVLLQHNGDFIGLAQTGTGKTAAFGIPLLERIDFSSRDTQALILAPTRELAQQICGQMELMSQKMGRLNIVPVFGGANIMNQIKDLRRGAQIIVATPGRLMDLMKRREISLDTLEFMVLDEADEMLNMGFKEDIDHILSKSGDGRRIWLFSATMAREIKRIVDTYMSNPEEIRINKEDIVNTNIIHQSVQLKASDKIEALRRFLDFDDELFGVVFCRTKRETQQVADELNNNGYATEPLHGDMSQAQRDAAMKRFRNKNLKLLIATDVAARGIDVNDLTHVIHYALPDDPEFYAHRSGRTARAGKSGVSLALVTRSDLRRLKFLEQRLGITFEAGEIPELNAITSKRISRWSENLINQEINAKLDPKLLEEVSASFNDVSKEEILARLLTREFNAINKRNSSTDLNDRSKGSDSGRNDGPRERGGRNDKGGEIGMKTFFINLGRKDNMNKGSLMGYICDVTGIKGNEIGRIVLDGAHSFMDVKEDSAQLMDKLNGQMRDGHELRANEHKGRVPRESRDGGDDGARHGRRSFPGRHGDGGRPSGGGGYGGGGRSDSRRDNNSSDNRGGSSRTDSFKDKSRGSSAGRDSKPSSDKPKGDKSRSKFFGSKWD